MNILSNSVNFINNSANACAARMESFIEKKVKQLICFVRFGNIMKNVESEKEKLILNRDIVQKKLGATPNTERVNNAVFVWLKESEKLIEDEENLKARTEAEIPDYDCSLAVVKWALSSDHEMRYGMYDEMFEKMKALNTNSELEPFSTTIPALEYFSSGYFVPFEAMVEASDRLLAALQDNNCSIIGLYGKRDSGKTKLVKIVGEKAKHLNIFDVVLFANVSKNPNAMRIQDEIAESLNLTFHKNSEFGRAKTIQSALESMNQVLVILDDVRTKIELEVIGIPNGGSNRCKVLLTTRSQRECGLMDCTSPIPLRPLSNDEAWALFQKYSGIEDELSSDILNLAHQIIFECEMLPGTIKEVGSSLKSKPVDEWKVTLDNLRHPARWQIFLSFRGKDTRCSFTGFLYEALCRGGFKTFMDVDGLHKGDQISPALIKAIEASRLSIVVLSENYASSPWCLDELAKIIECMQLRKQLVWPIFYKVQPSDIRDLKNNYGVSMTNHEQELGSGSDRLKKWRSALSEVSGLSGHTYKTDGFEYEYKFIQKILEDADKIKNRLYIRSVDMD